MTVQSLEFTRELIREQSGVVPVFLLTLRPPGLDVGRLARSPYRILSRGERFEATWFDLDFADDVADELGEYKITMANVGRTMVDALRKTTEPVPAVIEMVSSRDFDRVEFGPIAVEASSRSINTQTINITLGRDSIYREIVPNGTYNPRDEPSVFA